MTVYKVSPNCGIEDKDLSANILPQKTHLEIEGGAKENEMLSVTGVIGGEVRRAEFHSRLNSRGLICHKTTQSIGGGSERCEPIVLQKCDYSAGVGRENNRSAKKGIFSVEQLLVVLSAAVMLSGILTGALVWYNGDAREAVNVLLPSTAGVGFWKSAFNVFRGFLPFIVLAFLSSFFAFGSLLVGFDLFVFAIGAGFKICCVVNSVELGFGQVAKLLVLSLVMIVLVNLYFKDASLYSLRLLREGLKSGLIVFALKSLTVVFLLFLICCGAVAVFAK